MLGVTQDQLKSMFAGLKLDTGLGLTRAEMKMVLVLRDRLIHVERFTHVNQQMMMTAVLKIVARVGDTHVAQTETTPERSLDRSAVLRPNEIYERVLWSRLSLSLGG